ncbi:hypothetical protein [Yellowstone lake phycodnavirus 3]|uniref:hypothetical protein n=1 Tax=Yellowstone lake phycodnavirus 3 TaxID=1586715 RepID=UPI0006EB599B|nr:hypothetical protein AR677_gp164 [Yellowstone lake phycodnavirus 3]BAT22663.1 hypothetical protein [Yellowstone lake phycodnavirus 3]
MSSILIGDFPKEEGGCSSKKFKCPYIGMSYMGYVNYKLFLKHNFKNFRVPPFLFREKLKNFRPSTSNGQVRDHLVPEACWVKNCTRSVCDRGVCEIHLPMLP